jgi:methionine-S-sulfoxide reductase
MKRMAPQLCTACWSLATWSIVVLVGTVALGCSLGGTGFSEYGSQGVATREPPPLDLVAHDTVQAATFGLGCFWGAEARFGLVQGVVRTRVGYSGGTTADPTYYELGDHTETVEVEFDPSMVSYRELLDVFFAGHDCSLAAVDRQYMSVIFYQDAEQERVAREAIAEIETESDLVAQTEVLPAGAFYPAEDYHQKYALQKHAFLMQEMQASYPKFADFIASTTAARLNGYAYGVGDSARLLQEIDSFGLSVRAKEYLSSLVRD